MNESVSTEETATVAVETLQVKGATMDFFNRFTIPTEGNSRTSIISQIDLDLLYGRVTWDADSALSLDQGMDDVLFNLFLRGTDGPEAGPLDMGIREKESWVFAWLSQRYCAEIAVHHYYRYFKMCNFIDSQKSMLQRDGFPMHACRKLAFRVMVSLPYLAVSPGEYGYWSTRFLYRDVITGMLNLFNSSEEARNEVLEARKHLESFWKEDDYVTGYFEHLIGNEYDILRCAEESKIRVIGQGLIAGNSEAIRFFEQVAERYKSRQGYSSFSAFFKAELESRNGKELFKEYPKQCKGLIPSAMEGNNNKLEVK